MSAVRLSIPQPYPDRVREKTPGTSIKGVAELSASLYGSLLHFAEEIIDAGLDVAALVMFWVSYELLSESQADKVSLVAKASDTMGKIGDAIGITQILTTDYSSVLGGD